MMTNLRVYALLIVPITIFCMEEKKIDTALSKTALFYQSHHFDLPVCQYMCAIDHTLFHYTNIKGNISHLNLVTHEINSVYTRDKQYQHSPWGLKSNNNFIFCRYISNNPYFGQHFPKQTIRIIDPETSSTYRKYCFRDFVSLHDFACSQQSLATIHNNNEVNLFDIRHQKVAHHFTANPSPYAIELSPDTQTVITAGSKYGLYNNDKIYICSWDRRNTTKPLCKYAASNRINTLLAKNNKSVVAGLHNGDLICYSLKNHFSKTIEQAYPRPEPDIYWAQNTILSLKKCADNSIACLTKSKVTLYNEDYSKKTTIALTLSHPYCKSFDSLGEPTFPDVMETYKNKIIVAGKSSISMYEETE